MVKQIKTLSELDAILKEAGSKLVIIDFFATWCGPCRMIAPYIEELADTHKDVVFLKVDVDEADEVASKYAINVMPTFIYLKNGQKVTEVTGSSQEKVKEALEAHK